MNYWLLDVTSSRLGVEYGCICRKWWGEKNGRPISGVTEQAQLEREGRVNMSYKKPTKTPPAVHHLGDQDNHEQPYLTDL